MEHLAGTLHIALAALAAIAAIGAIGMSAVTAVGRNPGASNKIMVLGILMAALAEAIFFVALLLGKSFGAGESNHIAAGAFAAALAIGAIGTSAVTSVGRNPGASNKVMVLGILMAALAEAIFFVALLLGKSFGAAQSSHIAVAAFAAAIAIGAIGTSTVNAAGRNPGASNKIMVLGILMAALAEAIFFVALLLGRSFGA